MKRLFDLVTSLVLLVVLAPVMVIVAILVRATSPGPAFFMQTRLGKERVPFTLVKFRTMQVDTPSVGTHEVASSSITSIGSFLRSTKLDELPQLFNVIRGQMSLVGPRPCLPNQTELVALRDRGGIWAVRPGVTGLSQVNGLAMDEPERLVAMDAEYIRTRSFAMDMSLILRTVTGSGQGDKVRH